MGVELSPAGFQGWDGVGRWQVEHGVQLHLLLQLGLISLRVRC